MRASHLRSLAALLLLGLSLEASAQSPGAAEKALLNPLAALDPAKLDGFLGRPLFSPSRRPPAPPPSPPPSEAEAAPAEEPPPDVRLVGIIRTPKESIAQLIRDGGTERLSVRVGDFLGDWTVDSIETAAVTLKLGERQARFDIFRGGAAGPLPAANQQPGAQPSRQRKWSKEDIEGFFGKAQSND